MKTYHGFRQIAGQLGTMTSTQPVEAAHGAHSEAHPATLQRFASTNLHSHLYICLHWFFWPQVQVTARLLRVTTLSIIIIGCVRCIFQIFFFGGVSDCEMLKSLQTKHNHLLLG